MQVFTRRSKFPAPLKMSPHLRQRQVFKITFDIRHIANVTNGLQGKYSIAVLFDSPPNEILNHWSLYKSIPYKNVWLPIKSCWIVMPYQQTPCKLFSSVPSCGSSKTQLNSKLSSLSFSFPWMVKPRAQERHKFYS